MFTKIANNSYFGYLGAKSSRMYKKEIAEEITRRGREINFFLKNKAEKEGLQVIAGDSISKDSILKIYDSEKNYRYVNVEDLFTKVDTIGYDGKEYSILDDTFVESIDKNGKVILDRVKCVMRHKCNKQMYRINITNQHYIDATEDHSLCVYLSKRYNAKCDQINRITDCPTEEIGDKFKSLILKRVSINENIVDMRFDLKLYEYMGFHIGDGSLSFKRDSTGKQRWITKVTTSYCGHKSELENYFNEYLIENKWISGFSRDKRGNGCVSFNNSVEFGKFLYKYTGHSEEKHIPEFLFKETEEHICAVLRGYFSADGTIMIRNKMPLIKLSSINKKIIDDVKELLLNVGIASNYFKEGNENSYKGKSSGTFTHNLLVGDVQRFIDKIGFLQSPQMNKLLSSKRVPYKVEDGLDWTYSGSTTSSKIDYDDYVYDLTTEKTHRFFANNVLCNNTDSIFIKGVHSVEDGLLLEKRFNKYLEEYSSENNAKVIFKLKFEKFFRTLMFKFKKNGEAAKKKYIGHLIWEEGRDTSELYDKGSELTRSDVSRITKEIMKNFLNYILMDDNPSKASLYIKEMYSKVRNGEVSVFDISIPKAVRTLTGNDNVYKRGIKNTQQYLHHTINEGEKPRLVHLTTSEPDVFCIDEDLTDLGDWNLKVDWETMLEKNVTDKIKSYLEAAGLNWNSIIHGQQNLNRFFK
jgi:DNA polymerase I